MSDDVNDDAKRAADKRAADKREADRRQDGRRVSERKTESVRAAIRTELAHRLQRARAQSVAGACTTIGSRTIGSWNPAR